MTLKAAPALLEVFREARAALHSWREAVLGGFARSGCELPLSFNLGMEVLCDAAAGERASVLPPPPREA